MKKAIENQPLLPANLKFSAFIILAALFLMSCGGGGQDRVRHQQLDELKEKTTADLNSIINDIDDRIEFLDEEISEASGSLEAELEDARGELNDQKKLLETEIERIENATLENWNEVIEHTSEVTVNARNKTNEVSREVREMLED
jgi:hypothetical protein